MYYGLFVIIVLGIMLVGLSVSSPVPIREQTHVLVTTVITPTPKSQCIVATKGDAITMRCQWVFGSATFAEYGNDLPQR